MSGFAGDTIAFQPQEQQLSVRGSVLVVAQRWLEQKLWARIGRGRTWSFRLPTELIVSVLGDVATSRGDAFSLLHCETVQAGREWRSIYHEVPLEALTIDGSWQYCVRSRQVHPAVPAPEPRTGVGWPGEFALNGMIALDHPDPARADGSPQSCIGLVHRVGNHESGAVHEHRDANRLFMLLSEL